MRNLTKESTGVNPIKIHINWPFTDELVTQVRQISHRLEVSVDPEAAPGEVTSLPRDTEIFYASYTLPPHEQAAAVKWVQVHSAGVNKFMTHPLYSNEDVIFTNVSGIHAVPIAEHVLGQMLYHTKHMSITRSNQSEQHWPEQHTRWSIYATNELRGQTVGLVGYGSISREVARLASSFGMSVLALKRDLRNLRLSSYQGKERIGDPDAEIPQRFYPSEALNSMLTEVDFVVLALPLNKHTKGMINDAALATMKQNAILINVARGQIVEQKALVAALQQGQIAGASLDVFEEEPLPEDHPLWGMDNVVITPHISGLSNRYDERAIDLFCENLRRYLSGVPLLNVIDKTLGY